MEIITDSPQYIPYPKVQVFGFIACHIKDENDIKSLRRCIESASASEQSCKLDFLCISYSASTTILKRKLEVLARWFVAKNREQMDPISKVAFLWQTKTKQQFQHYSSISEYVNHDPELNCYNSLVLFSDADDWWANNRVAIMSEVALSRSCTVCFFPRHIYAAAKKEEDFELRTKMEYWTAAVRFDVFARFFVQADVRYLGSKYCDLAFVAYLRACGFEQFELSHGLYYYAGPHGCSGSSHSDAVLKEVEEDLMRNYPRKLEIGTTVDCYEYTKEGRGYKSAKSYTLIKSVSITDLLVLKSDHGWLADWMEETEHTG